MKRLLALGLVLALLLCGCAGGGEYVPTGDGLSWDEDYTGPINTRPQEEKDQTLALAYYADITLNPLRCTDYTNRALMTLMYQSLFVVDRQYQVEPMLCGRYSMSEDMRSYTFYVDEKATFSDGSPVRAADVVASLLAAKNSRYYGGRFVHMTSIDLTEDNGVQIKLDTAFENLPILLDIPIIPELQLESDRPIGSGPYVLDTAGSQWLLRRRSNWWCKADMAVTAQIIALQPAKDNLQIRDDFQFADLNLVCADPCSDRYADYRCDFELWDCENGIFTYIAFCDESEVFDSPEMRAALTYAIDRESLADNIYRGFGVAASLPASPLSPYYSQSLAEKYSYDPERFAQIVGQCGKDGDEVVFMVNSDDSVRVRTAKTVAQMLEAGGLKVTMKEVKGEFYTYSFVSKEYDIYMGTTKLSPNMDLSPFFSANGALSKGGVSNVGAYALCQQALENYGNYYTLHKNIMDDGLLCPVLFNTYAVYAIRGNITDLTPARDSVFYYSIGKTMEKAFMRN